VPLWSPRYQWPCRPLSASADDGRLTDFLYILHQQAQSHRIVHGLVTLSAIAEICVLAVRALVEATTASWAPQEQERVLVAQLTLWSTTARRDRKGGQAWGLPQARAAAIRQPRRLA
jgi:hypothetical protein